MPVKNVVLGEGVTKFLHNIVYLCGCITGAGMKIGAFIEVLKNAAIGARCEIYSHSFIYEGVTIKDDVFFEHGVVFTNDRYQRATAGGRLQTEADWRVVPTLVKRSAPTRGGLCRLYLVLILFAMFLSRQEIWAQQTSPSSTPSLETLLVMYGFGDRTSFPEGDVWPDVETWKQHWELVFSRFTVITGRTKDAGLVQRLRSKGILFAYHVVNAVNDSTQNSREERTSALVKEWSKPLEDSLDGQLPGGFDAISIDEFRADPDGSAEADIVADALREVRRLYPAKKIIVWGGYQVGLSGSCGLYGLRHLKGARFDVQLRALQDTGSFFIVECYVREGNPQFSLYNEIGRNLSKRFPSLFQRTIFGVAISQTAPYIYDDRPKQDFSDFLDQQLRHIRTNKLLKEMPGVGFWAFYRAKPVTIARLIQSIDQWFGNRK